MMSINPKRSKESGHIDLSNEPEELDVAYDETDDVIILSYDLEPMLVLNMEQAAMLFRDLMEIGDGYQGSKIKFGKVK